jgi:DNA-binding MarR family transcriptional regulator
MKSNQATRKSIVKLANDPASASRDRSERHVRQEDTIAYLIRETHRTLAREMQIRLARHDLSIGAWQFLRVLWESDGISQAELGSKTGNMASTTTAALGRMERRGLITRVRSSSDKRVINVHLTKRGQAMKRVLVPFASEINTVAAQGLTLTDLTNLRRILRRMQANFVVSEGKDVPLDDE